MIKSKELKQKWIAALRSKEYNQGKGYLCVQDENGRHYCCLGVLADVAGLESKLTSSIPYRDHQALSSSKVVLYTHADGRVLEERTSYLPVTAALLDDENQVTLTRMNDSGCSFEVIANYIEEHIQ